MPGNEFPVHGNEFPMSPGEFPRPPNGAGGSPNSGAGPPGAADATDAVRAPAGARRRSRRAPALLAPAPPRLSGPRPKWVAVTYRAPIGSALPLYLRFQPR